MKTLKTLALGAAMLASASVVSFAAMAKDVTVGVSWSNFQEERWKTDEAAIKKALDAHGAKYISADAQGSPTKQLTDVESLISKGANVLVILAMDSEAILPAVKKASDEGIPVIAYDRLIESPNVLYITFDNVGVGRMMAKAIEAAKPAGNYAFIKGDKGDPNADFLFSGITEVLKPAMDRRQDQGRRRILHRRLEAGQRPEEHGADPHQEQQQGRRGRNRERRHGRRRRGCARRAGVGRARCRSPARTATMRRSTASRSALRPCRSGRTRATSARSPAMRPSTLADGKKMTAIANVKPFSGGAKRITVNGILLTPLPVTKDNLNVIVDKGWITKEEVCAGVKPGTVAFCK